LRIIVGMPETVQAGFDLPAENHLIGLLRLDVPTILVMPLYYLKAASRRGSKMNLVTLILV
jgi:hypothetical protein